MNVLGSRRTAEKFAAAVDGDAPPRDAAIAALVAVVEQLRLTPVNPSPAFRLDLRGRLLTAAAAELVVPSVPPAPSGQHAPSGPSRPLRRRVGALAGAAVLATSTVGLGAGSAHALPGDLLYPVKRAAEEAALLVRSDLANEGRLRLEHAVTRLDEVDRLAHGEGAGSGRNALLIATTLEDFAAQADEGADDLLAAFEQEEAASAINELNVFTIGAAEQLSALAAVVPDGTGEEFVSAADAVVELAARSSAACRSCAVVEDDDGFDDLQIVDDMVAEDDRLVLVSADPGTTVEPVTVDQPDGSSAAPGSPLVGASPSVPADHSTQPPDPLPSSPPPSEAATEQGEPIGGTESDPAAEPPADADSGVDAEVDDLFEDPTDPADPTEPTEDPTEPTQPTEPTEATEDPADPTDPTEDPAEPTETPTDPTVPTDPNDLTDGSTDSGDGVPAEDLAPGREPDIETGVDDLVTEAPASASPTVDPSASGGE